MSKIPSLPSLPATALSYLTRIHERRSVYALSKERIIPDEELVTLVDDVVKQSPSAFHAQTSRVVVLTGKDHTEYWSQIVPNSLNSTGDPALQALAGGPRLGMFEAGYGTILCFEDEDRAKEIGAAKGPVVAAEFPSWTLQSSGMLQINLWNLLSTIGYGCNLQHYGPWTQEAVLQRWFPNNKDVKGWSLKSQLVFGKPTGEPRDKTFITDQRTFAFH
ncbi:unnamed protein product [Sympodiomycopsis kandeliae]